MSVLSLGFGQRPRDSGTGVAVPAGGMNGARVLAVLAAGRSVTVVGMKALEFWNPSPAGVDIVAHTVLGDVHSRRPRLFDNSVTVLERNSRRRGRCENTTIKAKWVRRRPVHLASKQFQQKLRQCHRMSHSSAMKFNNAALPHSLDIRLSAAGAHGLRVFVGSVIMDGWRMEPRNTWKARKEPRRQERDEKRRRTKPKVV